MKVLIDTSLILDVLLNRVPWVDDAIVTRNLVDFAESPIAAISTADLLDRINPPSNPS
jgi:hypothetical protein